MVNGATKPRRRKKITNAETTPSKKRRKKPSLPSTDLEGIPKRKRKKVPAPKNHSIEEMEVEDINAPISFDVTAHIPTQEELANFGKDKMAGFDVSKMLSDAKGSMGSIFDNLTNDSKTFGSKMDSILSLQMLALLPTIQNLDDTMYDERKAQAAGRLSDNITTLKNSLVQKQQFELKEEIDLHHPKLQKAFSFLTEAFFYVLTEVGIDASTKALIINALSLKMMGFEDELTKRFKGVAFSLLEQIENPLIEGLPNEKQLESIQEASEQKQLADKKANDDDYFEGEEVTDVIPDRVAEEVIEADIEPDIEPEAPKVFKKKKKKT